jgi:ring-1,2-phenylacetyl-CoA epoxidase subunit PaaE
MTVDAGSRRGRFHPLAVAEVRRLTERAVEVRFAVPPDLQAEFAYSAGQHVALRAHIDGREVRRSYSLCRMHEPGSISVALKGDRAGSLAAWVQSEVHPGDRIDVMCPQGTLTSHLADVEGRHVVGIAAGSGITPIMSLAETVLERSATSRVTLVYANRARADMMFARELEELRGRHPGRVVLHHVLSRERGETPLLSGRIDETRLRAILRAHIPPPSVDEWFLCGPSELVRLCRDTLTALQVDAARLRFELYATSEPGPGDDGAAAVAALADGKTVTRLPLTA